MDVALRRLHRDKTDHRPRFEFARRRAPVVPEHASQAAQWYTYCPYKGDCTYYSIPIGGSKSEYAVWTYEKPYEGVASIKEYLAFYPSRIDAIEVIS
jgi:uncharacterized protein (DUF427 family)